jgi:hypothetical protein
VRRFGSTVASIGAAALLLAAGVAGVAGADSRVDRIDPAVQLKLKLTSTMASVTISGDTLVCPPIVIIGSSGSADGPCEFTIASTGDVPPDSVVVIMKVEGLSGAESADHKFAIDRGSGPLVPFQLVPQTLYSVGGEALPLTVRPRVVWGALAGSPLDNTDLGAGMVVTFTVTAVGEVASSPSVSQSAQASGTELVGGATATAAHTATPPPTTESADPSPNSPASRVLLLICLGLATGCLFGLAVRRRMRRERG